MKYSGIMTFGCLVQGKQILQLNNALKIVEVSIVFHLHIKNNENKDCLMQFGHKNNPINTAHWFRDATADMISYQRICLKGILKTWLKD